MTIYELNNLVSLIKECKDTGIEIVKVYVYTNANNKQVMFAAFTRVDYNDIYESPSVENPVLIYHHNQFIGEYEYLNKEL